MRIAVIHDGSDDAVLAVVQAALGTRDAELLDVETRLDPLAQGRSLDAGDAVLRLCNSRLARLAEDRLAAPGVATLSSPRRSEPADLPSLWQGAGFAVRPEIPITPLSRDAAEGHVERLGGFPVGLRVVEAHAAASLLRIDSLEALYSALDLLEATGSISLLGPWEERPILWRVLLAGGEGVAAGKRVAQDLHWNAPGGHVERVEPRADVVALARPALAAALGVDTGSVDLLERRDSTVALLDAAAPPPLLELVTWAGEDAAAAVLEALVRAAERAAPPR